MTGHGIFKLFRYSESNLKQFAFQKADVQRHYLCQAWLNEEKLLVGTDGGKVLLFENGELRADIPVIKQSLEKNDSSGSISARLKLSYLSLLYCIPFTNFMRMSCNYLPNLNCNVVVG